MRDLVAEELLADGGHLDRELPSESCALDDRKRLGTLAKGEVGAEEPFTDVKLVGELDLSFNVFIRLI